MNITSNEELREWLSTKPLDWAVTIAVRAALRALPLLSNLSDEWLTFDSVLPFRASGIAWAACDLPKHDLLKPTHSASYYSHLNNISRYAGYATDQGPNAVNDAMRAISDSASNPAFWEMVVNDCQWLIDGKQIAETSSALARCPLWFVEPPENWLDQWQELKARLLAFDPNYVVWTEWFDRRINGHDAAFDIPGDKDRLEDKKILLRLADATDEDFWAKGPEYVNATLKGWLDEARARVALPQPPLGEISPDPQDARSPQFGLDAAGRIAINSYAGADELRSDTQSYSRHARAVEMAQTLGETLRSHNNAGYITGMVATYVAAMGDEPKSADPSGLVFAGDQLRSAIAKHRAAGPDDDLQPLPPSADRAADAYVSAHNMYAGSDPFLDDLDRTTRGPDAPLPAVNPEAIKRVVTGAWNDDILGDRTHNYMIAAADAAPVVYDNADRHSRFSAGLVQNFARYGVELLWAYPNETAWAGLAAGVGAVVLLGPMAAAGGTAAGITAAYYMARNIIANEPFYEELLATSPAGEDNFNRLMRFLKSLPLKSPKDN